jgi:rhodanese-related sulfurtransferase
MHVFKRAPAVPAVAAIDVDDLVAQGALLIDVRERREWDEARIAGAQLKPMSEVNEWYRLLPSDRQVILYCRSGQRSVQIIEALISQVGTTNLLNLTGGIIAWSHAGLPLET